MCLALMSMPVMAQSSSEPIPYDDDEPAINDKPSVDPSTGRKKRKRRTTDDRLRDDEEMAQRDEALTHLDDPNTGIGGELFAGLMLLESSRGAGVNPLFSFGVRATWEFGRLIPDEYLREMFFADAQWQFAQASDGTKAVRSTSTQHYFTVAPAVGLPFGPKSPIVAYAQVGAGFNTNFTSLVIQNTETPIIGSKFLFQYGIGIRGRPAVIDNGSIRISFRIELTRYLRGYMSDTFIGAGCGVIF